jgi:hypothetical protein
MGGSDTGSDRERRRRYGAVDDDSPSTTQIREARLGPDHVREREIGRLIGEYLLEQLDVIEGRTPGQTMSVSIHVAHQPVGLWIHIEDELEEGSG